MLMLLLLQKDSACRDLYVRFFSVLVVLAAEGVPIHTANACRRDQ